MRSRRRLQVSLGAVAIVAGLSAATLTAADAQPASSPDTATAPIAVPAQPIGHAGRWLVDAKGRVLVIHGINVSMKGPLSEDPAYDFGSNDAAYLAANGFNAVR